MGSEKRSMTAAKRGQLKKRRRHRAERREATRAVREAHNEMMRAVDHPGWVEGEILAWVW